MFEPTGPGDCGALNRPVVFFAHGNTASVPEMYDALLRHLVSRGFVVIFPGYPWAFDPPINYGALDTGFVTGIGSLPPGRVDLSRVGFVGHSFGAGAIPRMIQLAAARGWGTTWAPASPERPKPSVCPTWAHRRSSPSARRASHPGSVGHDTAHAFCMYPRLMPSMTIRDVPQDTRDVLAARAKASGRSLQEYVRLELIALAQRDNNQALMERVRARKARSNTSPGLSVEEILEAIHAGRR